MSCRVPSSPITSTLFSSAASWSTKTSRLVNQMVEVVVEHDLDQVVLRVIDDAREGSHSASI